MRNEELAGLINIWPVFLFVIMIVWQQIVTHFKVIDLKKQHLDGLELIRKIQIDLKALDNEFDLALKDHILTNKEGINKLTDAVTELIRTTSILSTKIELQNLSYEKRQNNQLGRDF